MTPKEKAKELVDRYKEQMIENEAYFVNSGARHCALIAIDEIEEALTDYGRGDSLQLQNMDSEFRFWEQVKQEIEKL